MNNDRRINPGLEAIHGHRIRDGLTILAALLLFTSPLWWVL